MANFKATMSFTIMVLNLATVVVAAMSIYPQIPQQFHQHNYHAPVNSYFPPPPLPPAPQVVYKQNVTNATTMIKGHDFVLGIPSPREQILLHTTVYKKPGLWSSYATKEITFPPRGSHLRVNITRIYATDRARNGNGAFVKLTNGGIGQSNATLLFRSQRNQPINFELDIFGYPK